MRASDLGDAGETITVAKASTGEVLGSHKVSTKASPAGEAPVEVLFVPGANPPVAYITNMYGGTLWAATWNPAKQDFDVAQFYDFAPIKAGVPLEMYFNSKGDRFYVTTAKPGQMHIFEVGKDGRNPKLLKSISAAEGAHHVAFTKDGRYAFVQNALLNLPGMSDGSITVIVGTVSIRRVQARPVIFFSASSTRATLPAAWQLSLDLVYASGKRIASVFGPKIAGKFAFPRSAAKSAPTMPRTRPQISGNVFLGGWESVRERGTISPRCGRGAA